MGVSFSLACPVAWYNDIESGLESIIVKSVSLLGDVPPHNSSLVDDNDNDNDSSLSIKQEETHQAAAAAAVKLQKVYKSFRTRRKLADCAVLVEQSWWKLLDFAELKHSSISFFDIQRHETALSRWSRAKTRAAKVGKGLSKDAKAQKLALQHWLEAIDPRHRYGHNLHFYYTKWLLSHSREPFFYWLDIGEGRDVHLDKCSRCKLQQQCIKYLGPMERKAYEVVVKDTKFMYKQNGEILDTASEPHAKWIFVLSTSKSLYVSKKKKGTFQHSSFLAGGATSAAGRLVVQNGTLKVVWPHSGHYRPTPENFQEFVAFLTENNVDLTDVKMDPVDEDEQPSLGKQRSSLHFRNSSEEDVGIENDEGNIIKTDALFEQETVVVPDHSSGQLSGMLSRKISNLQIPTRDELLTRMQSENQGSVSSIDSLNTGDDYDLASEPDDQADEQESIPAASILKRINSHKETKSYQLGKQLSCKWTTGAGPRIGCVRDYPSELQFRALEQVNLSPRSACAQTKSLFSPGSTPKASTPFSVVSKEQCKVQLSSPLSKGSKPPY